MAHKSRYIVENTQKYVGNHGNIVCRSSWERAVCKHFDNSPNVVRWNSEDVIIPYRIPGETKTRRYFMDFFVELDTGKKFLIEVKPDAQTKPPKLPKSGRQTKGFRNALETYSKNCAKWNAANEFCNMNGITFAIWTENTLRKLGIKIAG